FQAEDGIRDGHVTGVQTCALPIFFCIFALMTVPVILRRKPCAFSWETGAGDSGCVVILHSSSLRRLSSSERQRPSSSEPAWTERLLRSPACSARVCSARPSAQLSWPEQRARARHAASRRGS